MSVNTKIYNQRFFKNAKETEGDSAKKVAQILYKNFEPKSVIDIGCGAGFYLKEFENLGASITGYDGSPFSLEESPVKNKIKIYDLCEPLYLKQIFDLCICFEVAEHLEGSCSDTLVETLTKLSSTIIFTAATPGQGPKSIGHINEQPHEFWVNLFAKKKF